ncbi:hypothetical protein CPB84DRAFT_1966285 [Gymnopilus junonius]|uniref:BTB domain-containing protein n=1 Tax=Gymnopilus junonius TaxID=109634 RepID=A0A9P5NA75_GYMJU|nr:hypothetical protein CPB84DRAFT_1966285 [Gymnopilus junonius]
MTKGNKLVINSKFSAQDADITIKSSDGILFRLHRQNITTNSGAFPGSEVNTRRKILVVDDEVFKFCRTTFESNADGQVVDLTEPAKVLEIVFQFIYPRKHPSLKDLDFGILMEVAEAVVKYEIFSAMNTCEGRLSECFPGHAVEVFTHSVKADYPDLINKSASLLCRTPLLDMVEILPSDCVIPWIKYQGLWQKTFDDVIKLVESFGSDSKCQILAAERNHRPALPWYICRSCRVSLLGWIIKLSQIKTLSSLRDVIDASNPSIDDNLEAGKLCDSCPDACHIYLSRVKKMFENRFAAIPPFTDILKSKKTGV